MSGNVLSNMLIKKRFPKGNRLICHLKVYAQELLCQNTYAEGNDCNGYADDGHFPETGAEGFTLCNGGVVCKCRDDQNNYTKHAKQSQHILCIAENQVRCNQQNYGNIYILEN